MSFVRRCSRSGWLGARSCTWVPLRRATRKISKRTSARRAVATLRPRFPGRVHRPRRGSLSRCWRGEQDAVEAVRPLLEPMCRDMAWCGPVPNALLMKLSASIFLITLVTGLAESVEFAGSHGLDLGQFVEVLSAGQMASPVMRVKAPKLEPACLSTCSRRRASEPGTS
jgi:hypothetical protein